MQSRNWLRCRRTVRFGETDAAGVMHFHHLLRWCHEAYEESLETFGLQAAEVFAHPLMALPIVHCQADYRQPLYCGDALLIRLQPRRQDATAFAVNSTFIRKDEMVATAITRHVCIESSTRRRRNLPVPINGWLQASVPDVTIRP